jgi:hypothetical protein
VREYEEAMERMESESIQRVALERHFRAVENRKKKRFGEALFEAIGRDAVNRQKEYQKKKKRVPTTMGSRSGSGSQMEKALKEQ